jgi:hypothetical protein
MVINQKVFLKLKKEYMKQTLFIDKIKCDGLSYPGHKEVSEGVIEFYQKLYELREHDLNESDFYDNCTKLSEEAKNQMVTELLGLRSSSCFKLM